MTLYMNQLENAYREFFSAVDQQDRTRLLDSLQEIVSVNERRRADERVLVDAGTAALDARDTSKEARETLQKLQESSLNASLARAGFISNARTYVNYPLKIENSDIKNQGQSVLKTEEDLTEAYSDADQALSSISVPGTPSIVDFSITGGTFPVGETVSPSVTVANVGDESISSLEITVASEGEVIDGPKSIKSLNGQESSTVKFNVSFEEVGEKNLKANLNSKNKNDSRRQVINIFDSSRYLDNSIKLLETLKELVEENYTEDGRHKSYINKIDSILDRIRNIREKGRKDGGGSEKEANSIINEIESLQNELDAHKNDNSTKLPPEEYITYYSLAEDTKSLLKDLKGTENYS